MPTIMMCSLIVVFSMIMLCMECEASVRMPLPTVSSELIKQPPPASSAFSAVTLESHQLSSGKVIDCVRLHRQNGTSSLPLTLEEAGSHFPKAGSGWRKPTRAAKALFEAEIPQGCSAHAHSMPVQRGDIFEDVVHIQTPSALQHAYAIYSSVADGFFTGGVAYFTINAPSVIDGEVSLAQLWVVRNRQDEANYATLEVGWMVHPAAFEDNDPRLFIYWTNDDYGQTGCFNLLCPGFVQTDQTWTLGEKFPNGASVPGDPNAQQYVQFGIYADQNAGVWDLLVGGIAIGYWDPTVVSFGSNYADELQFGGEVQVGQLGSDTQMGSGHSPQESFPFAASVDSLGYLHDSLISNQFKSDELGDFATNPEFYALGDLMLNDDQTVDRFYYGGFQTMR